MGEEMTNAEPIADRHNPVASPTTDQLAGEGDQCQDRSDELDGLTGQVVRVLAVRRWQPMDGPFRGFNSPPGRF